MRRAGILMPIFSLSSNYGIGSFGKAAFDFVDFLKESSQTYWQILPIGPTGYGDSPYQSFCSFAGNPYFIDIDTLIRQGLLTQKIADEFDFGNDPCKIDYKKLFDGRFKLLEIAVSRFDLKDKEYEKFCTEQSYWIDDYAFFMAIKEKYNMEGFDKWDNSVRLRNSFVLKDLKQKLDNRITFWKVLQFWFYSQWKNLKEYANQNGILIVGDIPIYVSPDSAELWSVPQLFQTDENGQMIKVAGCPPDSFSPDGQLWGNPLYNWDFHKETGFAWWLSRLKHCTQIYDVLRIDHFRGFESYYSIDAKETTAKNGCWVKAVGKDFINAVKTEFPDYPIIAEDLGFLTEEVKELLKYSGFPGMKVLQFAFDSSLENEYLPHNYTENSVVYTGTHDNSTAKGWALGLPKEKYNFVKSYLKINDDENFTSQMIKACLNSVSDTCIIPIWDYLQLDDRARINTPGTLGGNWQWRVDKKMLSREVSATISKLTLESKRN